jgi:hypothetical protein
MKDLELEKFVASWSRAGFSEKRIAALTARFIRLADIEPPDDADGAWHVEARQGGRNRRAA